MEQLLAPPSAPRSGADPWTLVAADLAVAERLLRHKTESSAPGVARLVQHLSHYRGKRLRPALLLLAAKACGAIVPAHHALAAAVEMIHTATLVHDDVLDGASLRRHVPTVNAHWGTQASILLGDYLFTHAFHLTSTVDARACRIIGDATNHLCAGELHQVVERGNLGLDESAYFTIIEGKTAALTACCCQLGALYAAADADTAADMTRYGRDLGLAFQIADDLLDLVGNERMAGKSLGTDLEQRKLTLPIIRHLATATPVQRERFCAALQDTSAPQRRELCAELAASGALAYARRRAEGLAASAAGALECLPDSDAKSALHELTVRVVEREC